MAPLYSLDYEVLQEIRGAETTLPGWQSVINRKLGYSFEKVS